MAKFKICHLEGTHYVDVVLENETIRAEAGALSYMVGDVKIRSKWLVSPWAYLKSQLADQAVHRPAYTGTGKITLESSLGGFHVIHLRDEAWILEKGTYWASDGSVDVSFHRESILTSLFAGEGLIYLQTKVKGTGHVVIATRGPVEEMEIAEGQSVSCDGLYVIARTIGTGFQIRRATVNFLGRANAGEGWLRVFTGPGRVLLNPTPYWRYRMLTTRAKRGDNPAEAAMND